MSESNRQEKNPYPKGLGVGSVPVLFTLRNVQPNIVSGIANTNTNATTVEMQSSAGSATATKPMTTTATTTASQGASLAPVPTATKNNRSFNAVVAMLVIALCWLAIRNSQGNKTNSKETMAANVQSNLFDTEQVVASKVEFVAQSTTRSTDLKPFELGQPTVPSSATPFGTAAQLASATTTTSAGLFPDPISLNEPKAYPEKSLNEQSLVHAKPALLEPSTKPMTLVESKPAADGMVLEQNTTPFGNLSLGPRMATNPGSMPTNAATSQPGIETSGASMESFNLPSHLNASSRQVKGNDQVVAAPSIAETNEPAMATKDLIEVYSRVNKYAPSTTSSSGFISQEPAKQSVPAIAISNVAPRFESSPATAANAPQTKPIGMLSGQSYPPPSKAYTPLTIPAYEQDALGSRQGMTGSAQDSSMIRQPASGSNRYPAYKPISQPQSGNSIGFPPNPPGN